MNDRYLQRILVIVLAGGVLAGCGASAPPKRASAPVEPAQTGKPYDFRTEGSVPPASGATKDEADVEEIAVSDSGLAVTEADAPVDSTPAVTPADSLVDGFRIQVLATQDREVAEAARVSAAGRLGMPAYLELENGVYKVRVGDHRSRADADAALVSVRRQGYADAWVVASKVRAPRG
jgi:hypothetical protein